MFHRVLIIVIILVISNCCRATDYYVDFTNGTDSSGGTTTGTAWKTWPKIRTAAPPYGAGDTISLKKGETWSQPTDYWTGMGSGGTTTPIVLGSYSIGGTPTVSASSGDYAISFRNMSYWTIQDINFSNGDSFPVFFYPQTGTMTQIKLLGCIVTSNIVPNHFVKVGDNVTNELSNVEIGSCTVKGTSTGFTGNVDTVNVFKCVRDFWAHNNIFHGAGDTGSGCDIAGGDDHLFEKNIVYEMGNLVKLHGQQYPILRPIVRYNLYYDSPQGSQNNNGLIISDVDNGIIHNNSIYMGTVGISACLVTNISTNLSITNAVKIQNNIFYGSRNGEAAFEIDNMSNAEYNGSTTTNHNCYFATNGNAIKIVDTGIIISNSGSSTWSAQHVGDLFADPLFVNPSVDNYHLQWNSPCIDAGISLGNGSHTSDLDGNPVYGAPDMGAYEYQPPYEFGTNTINFTGSVRVYENGKYRFTTGTSASNNIYYSIQPSGGYATTTGNYMDVTTSVIIDNYLVISTTSDAVGTQNINITGLKPVMSYGMIVVKNGGIDGIEAITTDTNGSATFQYNDFENTTFKCGQVGRMYCEY